jgi:hypothetical protein
VLPVLPPALSVTVNVALRAPLAEGVKVSAMLQLAPAARLVPQLFAALKSPGFVPPSAMLEIVSAAEPLLLRVTV